MVVARPEEYGRHRAESQPGGRHCEEQRHLYATSPAYIRIEDGGTTRMTDDERVAVLHPMGRLNMVAAPAFKSQVEETVESGRSRIVVDLAEVTFIDSSGLGALIAGLKATRQAGGDLRLAEVPEQVMTVLRLTNLDRVLRAHPTVADASHDW
jgi:anti-sigma B factor antagonist